MRGHNCYLEIVDKKETVIKFNMRKYQQVLMEAKLIFQGYVAMSLMEFRDLPAQYGKKLMFVLHDLGEIAKAQQEANIPKRR